MNQNPTKMQFTRLRTFCRSGITAFSGIGFAALLVLTPAVVTADWKSEITERTSLVVLQEKATESGSADDKQQQETPEEGNLPAAPEANESQEDGPKSEQDPAEEPKTEEPSAEDGQPGESPSEEPQNEEPKTEEAKQESNDSSESSRRRTRRQSRYLQFAKFNDQLKGVLKAQVGLAAQSTVEVYVDDQEEPSAMGTVVDSNGFVMTKASSLNGRVSCRLANGREVPAIVYGIDPETDLALLRVQATNLPAVSWSSQTEKEAREGYWVLSPDAEGELLSIGVVSVGPRKIPPVSGFIGITMGEHKEGVPINMVVPGSAAEKYGLRVSDIITQVEDIEVEKREDIQAILRTKRPGDVVLLNIKRGELELALRLVLGNREEDSPEAQRAITQNTMSGEISRRRDDFPLAFQHDSVLAPNECGGPVVDLDGRVIGLNIARSGRVKSYALPMSLVAEVYDRLASGKFSPEIVFADRVTGYNEVLKSAMEQISRIKLSKEKLNTDLKAQDELIESTRNEVSELQAKLKELEEQLAATEQRLDSEKTKQSSISSQIRSKDRELEKAEAQKKELEEEKKQFLFGAN